MTPLLLHLIGDYLTQSDWMAQGKTKAWRPAIAHATVYSLPFLFIGSWLAVLVIWATHLLIDRFRLARYVVWAKNLLFSPHFDAVGDLAWENCKATGYPSERPVWMSVWLLIIADNTLHLCINALCLRWL